MQRKAILILLISILCANILLVFLPNIIYGFNSFFGYDLFGTYGRVNSICYRNVPIEESGVYKGVIETYPPGFHVLLAGIKFLTLLDTFQLNFCFKIVYVLLFVLLMFMIGNKVNKKYAIFALFATFTFQVAIATNLSGYTAIIRSIYARTEALTFILVLVGIYSIMHIFSKEKSEIKDIPYYFILFLAFTVHGISHIGGFIMNSLLFVSILVFFYIYYFFKRIPQFLIKSTIMISTIFLSFALQLLIHWGRVIDYANAQGILHEEVESYLGISIIHSPILENYWLLALLLFIISFIVLILSRIQNKKPHTLSRFKSYFFEKRLQYVVYAIYVVTYVYGVFFVTQGGPRVLAKLFDCAFTLYFGPPYTLATIATKLFGLFLYVLSFLGVVFFLRQTNIHAKLIGWIYLIAYFLAFTFFTPFSIAPDRVIRGVTLLYPFMIAGGLSYLWDFFEKRTFHFYRWNVERFYSVLICGFIIFSLLSINVVTMINKEPSVIEHEAPKNIPFKFGSTSSPRMSNELIYFVNTQIESNSHILATGETQRILASVTSIEPIFVGWGGGGPSTLNVSHVSYGEVYNAMSYIDSDYFSDYIEKYNATYMITLPQDLNNMRIVKRRGVSGAALQKYFDSKLSRVYTTSYGGVVYTYSNNS